MAAAGPIAACVVLVAAFNLILVLLNANNPFTKKWVKWRGAFFTSNRHMPQHQQAAAFQHTTREAEDETLSGAASTAAVAQLHAQNLSGILQAELQPSSSLCADVDERRNLHPAADSRTVNTVKDNMCPNAAEHQQNLKQDEPATAGPDSDAIHPHAGMPAGESYHTRNVAGHVTVNKDAAAQDGIPAHEKEAIQQNYNTHPMQLFHHKQDGPRSEQSMHTSLQTTSPPDHAVTIPGNNNIHHSTISASATQAAPSTFFAFDIIDPSHAVTGWVTPWGMLGLRLFQVALFTYTLVWDTGIDRGPDDLPEQWFRWFTNWTFVSFGLSAMLGSLNSCRALAWPSHFLQPRADHYDWLAALHHLVFTTACCSSMTVALFSWTVLGNSPSMEHGGTAGMLLLELMVCRLPVVSYHAIVVAWYVTAYGVFMWVWAAVMGVWMYDVMDWTKPLGVVYYVLLVVLLLSCFGVMYVVAWLRERLMRMFCPSLLHSSARLSVRT